MPVDFRRYFTEIGSTSVFITSFDGRTARIYPIDTWEEVERLLEAPGEHATGGEDLLFIAQMYGGDADLDGQGRFLLPATLRRKMGVENQPVYLFWMRGHLEVFSQTEHDAKQRRTEVGGDSTLRTFTNLGLR